MKTRLEALGVRWSRTKERGATAVVIALCLLLFMAAAAMSFDTANLALQRQKLANIIDAAAQAGASSLPDPVAAKAAAEKYAALNDATLTPSTLTITFLCVVGSVVTRGVPTINYAQIPSTCYPGTAGPYTKDVTCDQTICVIPCNLPGAIGASCNTMRVSANRTVPFYFAPAIGIPSGKTGAITSVSCKGSCGSGMPNPLDVAIVADRTNSLPDTKKDPVFSSMKKGISDTLSQMTPELQFVTLGTIHKSSPTSACDTYLATETSNKPPDHEARAGTWMPMDFSNNYLTGKLGDASRPLNTKSRVVTNVDCMNQATQPWGTHLASPMKYAARKLLGIDSSSLSTMSVARSKLLTPGTQTKKVLIMETDGVPEETIGYTTPCYSWWGCSSGLTDTNTSLGWPDLNSDTDITSGDPDRGDVGCNNLLTVAQEAKDAGITVIMIAYGNAATAKCILNHSTGQFSGSTVKSVMAEAASPGADGQASQANYDCGNATGADKENSDNDNFYCAANGAQLASIFSTAIAQVSAHTKFIKVP